MKREAILLFILTLICNLFANAQEPYYYDDDAEKEYAITKDLPSEIIDKYLEKNELKDIEFNPDTTSVYTFRVQEKSGDWMLCHSGRVEFVMEPKYSLHFPNSMFGYGPLFTLASDKKKSYFYTFNEEKILKQLWFEEIEYYKIPDTLYVWNDELQADEKVVDFKYLAALKRKKKWALFYLDINNFEQQVYQTTPFSYESIEELPIADVTYHLHEIKFDENRGFPNFFQRIDDILSEGKYEQVVFNSNEEVRGQYPMKFKNSKNNWSLYDSYHNGIISLDDYSIQFPKYHYPNVSIAENKGKKYFISLAHYWNEGFYVNKELWFDQLEFHFYEEYAHPMDPLTEMPMEDSEGNSIIDTIQNFDYFKIKRDESWAMAFYSSDNYNFYQLSGFHFKSADNIPDSILSNYYWEPYNSEPREYQTQHMEVVSKYLQENQEIDLAEYFGKYKYTENEWKSILMVRHAETKRWSIIIPGGTRRDTETPIAVNKINQHEYGEDILLEVWCENKVGYYFYDTESYNIQKMVNCEFDDFKYVNLDYTYGCALKRNGYWELFSAEKPTKLVEGNAQTIEGLINLWMNR
jgi:hypothetical protein